ncbi:hypothetical protein, partial [Burkholderia multivorans]|uniref:hypothetical protein n=1 Tax=Burkholderia multivorans TaxID=87883 RepID=UPI0021BF5F61
MNTLVLYVPLILRIGYGRDAKALRASDRVARRFIVTRALNEQNHIGDYGAHVCERLTSHAGQVSRMVVVCNDSETGDSSSRILAPDAAQS